MLPREKVFNAISHKEGPIPWVEIRVDNEIAGRAVGRPVDSVNDVKDWIEVARKVGLDCANVRTIHRFGTTERKKEGAQYAEVVPLLKDWADLEKIGRPLPDESEVQRKIKRAKENQPEDELAVFGVTLCCVDPTALSMGFENFFIKVHDDVKLVAAVLDIYTDYCEAMVEIFSAAPEIDFLWIADDMAYDTGPYLGPRLFKELILPRYRRVAAKIKKPWVFHSDGDLRPVLEDLLSLGMSALHPIQPGPMDIYQLKKEIGERVCLVGNVDLEILTTGTPEQVREEVFRLAEICGRGGGYVLSSSNSIPDWIKLENFLAMGEAVQAFNRSRFS